MTPEFSRLVPIARLPEKGREIRLEATESERAALAARFAIPAVNRLEAVLRLLPEPGGGVRVRGRLDAEVVQDCVVTLEPVVQAVAELVELRLLPPDQEPSDDPESPDEIDAEGDEADLGEAIAEQLSLALDPYPRAPGAELPPEATSEPAGPFAALSALRGGRGG